MIWILVRPGVRGRMPRGTNVRRLAPGSLLASPDFWPFPFQLTAPHRLHPRLLSNAKSGWLEGEAVTIKTHQPQLFGTTMERN